MLYRRYIFREVLWSTLFSLLFFTFVLLTGNLIKDVIRLVASGQMSSIMFFRTLLMLIPSVAVYALPLGLLTGVLMTLGRLSAQQEILVLKTSGLGLPSICSPIFFLAIVGVVLSLFVNLFYAPRALSSYRQSLREAVRQDPLKFLRPRVFIRDFSGYVLYASGQEKTFLTDFRIWEFDGSGHVSLFLFAERGEFHYDSASDSLQLSLQNGSLDRREKQGSGRTPTVFFKDFSINLPLGKIFGATGSATKRLKHMDFFELLHFRKFGGESPTGKDCRTAETIAKDRKSADFVLSQHLAMAFSSLVLTVLAIPLSLQVNRKETSANVALALVLGIFYYLLMVIFSWLQLVPGCRAEVFIWTPNILLFSLGLGLFMRANRR